jgi:hypothetical protein
LQPCVFEHPRQWTTADQEFINRMITRLIPLVQQYVQKNLSTVVGKV